MKLTKLLTAIGLSKNEAKVYLTLLKGGTQTISTIARKSTIHRPAIYAALPILKEKGLVNERQIGKLIHYGAESPGRLRFLLEGVRGELDAIIPELERIQSKRRPVVRRLDGKEGVRSVYDDIVDTLKKGDVFYRYSSVDRGDIERVGLPRDYEKQRDAKELERFVIASPDHAKTAEESLDVEMKVVPKEFYPFDYDVSQIIYGDKIAFIDYDQPVATIIENPVLAQFQRDIFKMLFRTL